MLFLNLADLFEKKGDNTSARRWKQRGGHAALRLGTRHFSFIALQQEGILIAEARALRSPYVVDNTLPFLDLDRIIQREKLANNWYQERIKTR